VKSYTEAGHLLLGKKGKEVQVFPLQCGHCGRYGYRRKAHVGIEKKEELAFGHLRELRTSPRFSQPSRRRAIPEDHPEPGIGQGRKDVLGPIFRALFVDEDLVVWVILAEKGAQALPNVFGLIPHRNENRNFLGLFGLSFRKSGEASEIQKGEGQKD
jgi:hypothetical protein